LGIYLLHARHPEKLPRDRFGNMAELIVADLVPNDRRKLVLRRDGAEHSEIDIDAFSCSLAVTPN